MNSPSDTLKSQLITKDAIKPTQVKMTESTRLPSNVEEQHSDSLGERQAQLGWSAVLRQDAADTPARQPDWDSHQLGSPGKQESIATSQQGDGRQEPAKRNLENIMANKKPSQPGLGQPSEQSRGS